MRALGAALLICLWPDGFRCGTHAIHGLRLQRRAGNTDECPAGHYMMGVEARTGGWFDQIAVVCGRLRGDGSLVRANTLDRRGGGGGAATQSICNENEAVSQLRAWRTDGFQIRSVELT